MPHPDVEEFSSALNWRFFTACACQQAGENGVYNQHILFGKTHKTSYAISNPSNMGYIAIITLMLSRQAKCQILKIHIQQPT
jgi:hypothetical protein